MVDFEYLRATSLEEAARMFAEVEEARYLAGGQSLLPLLKLGLGMPSRLIDLRPISDLATIRREGGTLILGAMVSHAAVAASPTVAGSLPALAGLAAGIGDPQVRNWGTIGGALAHGDPATDYAAAVLGLGAAIRTDRRSIPADAVFRSRFKTALDAGEIVREVRFPLPRRAGYAKLRNPASGYPMVGVFVAQTGDGVRVAVTGAAPSPFRLTEAEQALACDFSPAPLSGLSVSPQGLNADLHADPRCRAHLVAVMARRAVAAAR